MKTKKTKMIKVTKKLEKMKNRKEKTTKIKENKMMMEEKTKTKKKNAMTKKLKICQPQHCNFSRNRNNTGKPKQTTFDLTIRNTHETITNGKTSLCSVLGTLTSPHNYLTV